MRTSPSERPSRTSASIFFLGFSYLSVILVFVQGIVLVPLYLEQVTTELYGGWLATGNLLTYLSLFDFGFSAVMNQQIAQAYGAGERNRVAELSGTGIVLGMGLACLVGITGFLLAPYAPSWVGVYGDDAAILSWAVAIAACASAITLFVYFLSNISLALQRSLGVGIATTSSWSLGIGATLVCLSLGWGLVSIPFGYLVRSLTLLAGVILHLGLSWNKDIGIRPVCRLGEVYALGSLSSFVFLGRVGGVIMNQSDSFIIAILLGPEQAAVFSLTGRAKDAVQSIPDRIAGSVVPGMAHLSGEGDAERVKRIALDVLSVTVGIASVCAAGIIGLNESFVGLWVGSDLYGGNALTWALCGYFLLAMVRNALSRMVFSVGEIRIPSMLGLIEAGVRILLVVALTLRFGLIGVPVGASLALLLANGIFLVRIFAHKFGIGRFEFAAKRHSLFVFPLVAVTAGSLWMILGHAEEMLGFVIQVALLGGGLLGLLWLVNDDIRRVSLLLARRLRGRTGAQIPLK